MQVAGVPVGKIQSIDLTPDGQADVRMKITDAGYRPLRRGTKAVIRQASLSGVANRYIDLQLPAADHQETIPAGGVIDQSDTTTAVDLDQLFNTFDPKTRKALSGLIRGSAAVLRRQGRGGQRRLGLPEPVAGGLQPALQGARLRHARAQALHRRVLAAGGRPRDAPRGPRGPRRPPRHHDRRHRPPEAGALDRDRRPAAASCAAPTRPSSTCAPRSTTSSRSSTSPSPWPRSCAPSWPSCARWRATRARRCATSPRSCARPGAANDLIELTKSSVPLRNAAVGPTKRNGKQRDGAFPASTKALEEAAPELGDGAALRARPHRLVRRLQPLGPLRRARRRQPRRAVRQPLRARQRRAQAAARPALRRATPSSTPPRLNQRWRCPGVGRARRDLEADARLPLRRLARSRSGHEARRSLTLLVVAAVGVGWIVARPAPARTPTRASTGSQFDNAFGLIQGGDLKIAGVRAGKITDIKLDKRTKHALDRLQDRQERLRLAAHRRLLRVAPAVADRRVLRRLPARHGASRSSSRARSSRSRARRRRSRPTSSTTSCAAPTASA